MRNVLVFALLSTSVAHAAGDPFAPYLESVAVVKDSLGESMSGSGAEAITTKRFTFSSKGGVNTVFAIQVSPQAAGKYPGVLILHGGGSHADDVLGLAESLAKLGYVTLALDQPGICGTNNTPSSSGPWKSRPGSGGEPPRFEIAGDPSTSILVDAAAADLEAFNYLRAQPNVNGDAMGITGFSWGGYATTLLSGLLGSKVKASYAVFGCGYYDKGSYWQELLAGMSPADRDPWLMYLDAGRRAPQIESAHFLEAESNDTFFWPEAVSATMDAMGGDKNHVWGPNLNHQQMPAGFTMQRLHFDYRLKGMGSPFAKAAVTSIEKQPDGSKQVGIGVDVPDGVTIDKAELYYSEQTPTWQERKWVSLAAAESAAHEFKAAISAEIAAKQINFYAFVTDTRTVSVSSAMYDSTSVVVPNAGGSAGAGGVGGVSEGGGSSGGVGGASAGGVGGNSGGTPMAAAGSAGSLAGSAPMSAGQPGASADSSCSCQVPGRSTGGKAWLALLALAGLARRRRS